MASDLITHTYDASTKTETSALQTLVVPNLCRGWQDRGPEEGEEAPHQVSHFLSMYLFLWRSVVSFNTL
jgi:hypothetical protein